MNYLAKLYDFYMKTDFMTSKNNEKLMSTIVGFIEVLLGQIKQKMREEEGTPNYQALATYYHKFATLDLLQKVMDEDFRYNKYQVLKYLITLIAAEDFSMQKELIRYALKRIRSSLDGACFGLFECL